MNVYGSFTADCTMAPDWCTGVILCGAVGCMSVAVGRLRFNITWPVRVHADTRSAVSPVENVALA